MYMEVTSTEIQNNFGTYLKLARVEDVFVTRNGKRIAILKYWDEPSGEFLKTAESTAVYREERPRMSEEEFLKLTDTSDNRFELIDGEVYQLASPSYEHQRILGEIFNQLYQWSGKKKCKPIMAPFDVRLMINEAQNIVQPDIIIICDPENVDAQGKYNGVPTLAVEILSESTRSKDMIKKLNLFMCGGIKEYWIVNPWNREVYIYFFEAGEIQNYRAYKGAETASSEVLDGLSIQLEQVFVVDSLKVNFYAVNYVANEHYKFAVIVSRYDGKWVFCKHKDRTTYEIPGGHREENEIIDNTAKRELYEETGATEFKLSPVSVYSVEVNGQETFGMLFYAEITAMGELPDLEIEKIELFDELPDQLTYPLIQPKLFARVKDFLEE
jgi:Uma2 family endonuclease/8-oxo-dGTP pyrophosphatase MutT (NUDIX family)